jgi:hypothetical protein
LRRSSVDVILPEQIGNERVEWAIIGERPMLITMKNSELIDKLVVIAAGNFDLVQEAIRACATGPDGAADLTKVVEYIVEHRAMEPAAA